MSTPAGTPASTPVTPSPAAEIVLPEVTVVDRKAAVMFWVLTIALALMLILAPQEGDTSFRLKAPNDFVELPTITVPSTATAWVLTLVCALCTAAAIVLFVAAPALVQGIMRMKTTDENKTVMAKGWGG